jgi:hypothetical protein
MVKWAFSATINHVVIGECSPSGSEGREKQFFEEEKSKKSLFGKKNACVCLHSASD